VGQVQHPETWSPGRPCDRVDGAIFLPSTLPIMCHGRSSSKKRNTRQTRTGYQLFSDRLRPRFVSRCCLGWMNATCSGYTPHKALQVFYFRRLLHHSAWTCVDRHEPKKAKAKLACFLSSASRFPANQTDRLVPARTVGSRKDDSVCQTASVPCRRLYYQ